MKTCSKCKAEKAHEDFNRRSRSKDGLESQCRACREDYWESIREARVKYQRSYYQANREVLEAKKRARRDSDRGAYLEKERAYYAANRVDRVEFAREYRKANPHSSWAAGYRKRARLFGFEPTVEDFTKPDVIDRYGDACFYCGGEFQELDHYVPVSKGGQHTLDNVRPSCAACNLAKFQKDGDEFTSGMEPSGVAS